MDLTVILRLIGEHVRIVKVNQLDVIGPTIQSIFALPNTVYLWIGCKGKEILPYLTFQEHNIKNGDVLVFSIKKNHHIGRKEQFLSRYKPMNSFPPSQPSLNYLDQIRELAHIFDTTFLSLEGSSYMIPVLQKILMKQEKVIQKYHKKMIDISLDLSPAPEIMTNPLPNPFESY